MKIIPVILSGGSGSRLWPLSREEFPKQFLKLTNNLSLFQNTIERLKNYTFLKSPIVICNVKHRFIVAEQLREINVKNATIILEPIGKNTAPAITAASLYAQKNIVKNNERLLVLSSDHLIDNFSEFITSLKIAIDDLYSEKIFTFGIDPYEANSGYGYIEYEKTDNKISKIKKFIEKPNEAKSKELIATGNYLWNSGIFLFSPDFLINEVNLFENSMTKLVKKSLTNAKKDMDFIRLDKNYFGDIDSKSIDVAVLEKTSNAMVIPIKTKWTDLGTWSSIYSVKSKDENLNVISGDVCTHETHESLILNSGHLVATMGIKDLVIVNTKDATLVADKKSSSNLKSLFSIIAQKGFKEAKSHTKVYRPWGTYETLSITENFHIKKIIIFPGGQLSLQSHKKRAEHWVIIKGKATVTCGHKEFELGPDESTYIPKDVKHRLENKTKKNVEIVEVQSGDYFGEDDIQRFDDKYGRSLN